MVQSVKNPTTVASAEAWMQYMAQCSGFKDPVLPQLWRRSQIQSMAQKLPYIAGMAIIKKINKKIIKLISFY